MKEYFYKSANVTYYMENNEFFKNSEQLTLIEEDKTFDITDFKKLIQQDLNAILHTKFDNIVLLAGAGASVVVENDVINNAFGKTVAMIAQDVFEQLNERSDIYSLVQLSKIIDFGNITKKITDDNNVEIEILSEDFNLEDFLSSLQHYAPYVKRGKVKYEKSLNTILKIIKKNTDYSYDRNKLKHGTILNILIKKIKSPNKLSVVTTNYDTLFEEAGAKLNYIIFDGFNFVEDPKFESDIFDWNLIREVPIMKTSELEYRDKVFNLIKIHGSLTWERGEDGNIYRKKKNAINNINNTVMIFPSSDKYAQSYQEPYFELFTKFQELLKKQNTLLITTGFSFSDNHISKMITQAIKNNSGLTVVVSDFNIDQQNDNWKEITHLMEVHNPIVFLKATLNDGLTEYLGGKYAD
ncbi:SIR2 family protein [Streptococcus suis]|uniref:SIR2 family protein n=1 Tax=Streptococcus suis TaxID=1307 RepID=UPI002A78B552|nr:SIR2 family protein [Streptococcus suis]HEM5203004.1 SIR2 family protein [Streptococcus suis]HEM5255887.1 SIR2 family protein [Streptococcus suis]